MTKKITAILLSFIMVLTFMPTMAFADPVPTLEPIGPVDFTNMTEATANANYSWEPSDDLDEGNHELVLNGGTIDGTLSSDATFAIKVPAFTNIIISGDSKIIAPISNTSSNAILAEGSLQIRGNEGTEKLTIDVSAGAAAGTVPVSSFGIFASSEEENEVYINDMKDLVIKTGAATTNSCGIYANSDEWAYVSINRSTVTVTAAESSASSVAIWSRGGSVDMEKSSVKVTSSKGDTQSIGILTDGGSLKEVKSTLNITAGESKKSIGIYSENGIEAVGSQITAKSAKSTEDSIAISSDGSIQLLNTTVSATAEKALFKSIGIYENNDTTIIGSKVDAIAANVENNSVDSGDSDLVSAGIFSEDYSIITSNCTIVATAGDVSANSPSSNYNGKAYSTGIFAYEFNLSSGNVTATGKKVKVTSADGCHSQSHGVYTDWTTSINDGSLTATANDKLANECQAIQSYKVDILGGTVNAKVVTADAIMAIGELNIGSNSKKAFLENAKMAVLDADGYTIKSWNTIKESSGVIESGLIKPSNVSSPVKITFNGIINSSDDDDVEDLQNDELTLTYGSTSTKIKKTYSSTSGGSLTYTTSNDKVATVASDGTVTAVGVGTATITIKDSKGSTKTVTVKVTAKALASSMVSAIDAQDYTGANIYPTVTVKDGTKTLVKDTDYTLTYTNNKEIASKSSAKAPSVTVTGKGNYTGTVSVKFSITRSVSIDIPEPAVGSDPKITIKDGTKTLKEGTDYTVTYANEDKIGYATATIKGKGAYADLSKVVTFKVLPKKSAVNKFTVGKKSVTLKWKKVNGVDGYWLRLSTTKNFAKFKKVKVGNPNALKKVVKGLKTGKRYYVKVRGYKNVLNGSKVEPFYGKWSAAKRTAAIK